jgi:nitrate reductase beta subunit
VTLSDRVSQLCENCGSLRAAARAVRIDVAYLSRLATGEKTNPSKSTLKKLGLRKITAYERI